MREIRIYSLPEITNLALITKQTAEHLPCPCPNFPAQPESTQASA